MNVILLGSSLFLLGTLGARAQVSVIVNPNGTHTVMHHNGTMGLAVNPDGTHLVLTQNGNTAIATGATGTTVILNVNSNPTVLVNPNGTHSVLHRNENTSPEGAATIVQPARMDSTRRPF